MNKRVENYILWLNKLKSGRKRAASLVLALSVAVSGNVFWFMRGTGTALAGDPEDEVTGSSLRENAEDWEKTLPELSGSLPGDLVSCAVSQTGYTETEDGYTRYGEWYGNPTGD